MTKNLLMLAAVSAIAVSANALDLPLDDLSSGWSSSYDAATKTITYDGAWTGRGWWLESVDYSAYDKVVIEIEPATIQAQINVEYNAAGSNPSSSGLCDLGASSITVPLDPNFKNDVKQIYIQCGNLTANPTMVLKSASVVSNDGDDSALWEGSYTASGWNAGVNIADYQVKEGDLLHYYMTPGAENAQVLIKGADWNNLLGTSKITNSDIMDGVVEVVVTDEMLKNCGGKFFLQGDGGISCTKVEIAGTEEAEIDAYMLNGGQRALPAELYVSIPEDSKYLNLIFFGNPTWLQVCDASWNTLVDNSAAIVTEETGFSLLSFALTPELIEAINAKNQIVLNGDNECIYQMAFLTDEMPQSVDPLYTVGNVDNDTPWWSAWSPTLAMEGNGTISFEFVNYTNEVQNWNNWLVVYLNSDTNPVVEGYGASDELVVIRADNYGWGALYDNTQLTNDYNWDTFKQDMNGAYVTLDITREGQTVTLNATIETESGDTYNYNAVTTGVTSEVLGAFLTVEGGHLDVYKAAIDGKASIASIANDDAPVRIYNINGIEVSGSNLPAGLYIMKQGAKTSKILVR